MSLVWGSVEWVKICHALSKRDCWMACKQMKKNICWLLKISMSLLTSAFQKSFRFQVHFRRLSFVGISSQLGSCVVVIRQHLGGQVCSNVQILCAGCHFLSLIWKIYPEHSHSRYSYTLFLFSILIWFTLHNKCFILTVITANLHKDVDHQDIVVFQCLHSIKCKAFVWGFLFCASLNIK